MRLPRVRFTVRRMMVAVAVVVLAAAAGLRWPEVARRRAQCLAFAGDYRWYEARFRHEAELYRACASRHPDARRADGTCPACGLAVYRWMRAPDGRAVRSAAEEAAALRQAADLYARMAGRNERLASLPWLTPTPLPPAERDAWELVRGGKGPVSMKFFEVQ